MFPLSSFTYRFNNPASVALNLSGPAVLIIVDDGNRGHIRLSSCLRYGSVPVSTSDSLVSKSLNFVTIYLADIILVDAGIATLGVHCFSSSAILFQIVVSVEISILKSTPPHFCNYE
jgi:hypothetical protein